MSNVLWSACYSWCLRVLVSHPQSFTLPELSLSLSPPPPTPPHSHPHTHTVRRDAAFVLDYNLEQAMRVSQPGCGTLVLRGTTPRQLSDMPSYPSVPARVPPLHPPLALSLQHIRSTSVGDAPPHIALRVAVGVPYAWHWSMVES